MSGPIPRLNAALEGRYRLDREIGAGGMATVYLAEDLRHRRQVAVKVLDPQVAAAVGADRFLAEIETTANLQHPNILPLFDSGEADGAVFFVMPFVDGETLRDRLDREKELPVDDAVRIATEIAEALDYAHRQGVVHRDVKPANILLREGRPLVADFGIALAAVPARGAERLTETGVSLGTPHYMSPEQATGSHEVGPAADVYAAGCVLYEMLAGHPPHTGTTARAVLARVITGKATPVSEERPMVPAHVRAAVARAIERLPADRFRSAGEFARALADPGFRYGPSERGRSGSRWLMAAALSLAGVAVATALWTSSRSAAAVRDIGLAPDAPIHTAAFRGFDVAPDGGFVLYEADIGGTTQLWYRSLTGRETRPVPGTEGAFGTPRISPDGSRVAFVAGGELKIAPLDGGSAVAVAEVQDPYGGGWLESGLLFFADEDGRYLRWIDPETGPVRRVDVDYCLPARLIGDGERVLCGGGGRKEAYVRDLERPMEARHLRVGSRTPAGGPAALRGSDFRIVDGDYLVYMSTDGTLMGTRFEDRAALTVGRSVSLVPSVRREAYSGAGQFDVGRDGTLVYVPGTNADIVEFVRLTQDGRLAPLSVEPGAHQRFSLSPNGSRLATVSERAEGQQLRVYGLADGTVQVLDEAYKIGQPRWSPDGDDLVYTRWEDPSTESLVRLPLSSPAGPEVLMGGDGVLDLWPASYLAEDFLLLGSGEPGTPAMVMDPSTTPPALDSLEFSSLFVSMSPDRRWLAYQDPGGTNGIQIQPWPGRDRRHLVDQAGNDPRWASNRQLTYWAAVAAGTGARSTGVSFYRVAIEDGAGPPVGARDAIFEDPRFVDTPGPSFDVTPDGDLIYLRSRSENRAYYFRVVPGWADEMKRAVDAANREAAGP